MMRSTFKRALSAIVASAMMIAYVPAMTSSAAKNCRHSFNGSYSTVRQATCTSTGLKVGKCTKCRDVVSRVSIPKKDHNYKRVSGSKVHISPDGRQWMYVQCTVCRDRTLICVG